MGGRRSAARRTTWWVSPSLLLNLRSSYNKISKTHTFWEFIMHFQSTHRVLLCACVIVVLTVTAPCRAHFLWIKSVTVDGKPQGLLFFNENPFDETYHFPEKLANAKLWCRAAKAKPTEVATKGIDTDERVGLIGP